MAEMPVEVLKCRRGVFGKGSPLSFLFPSVLGVTEMLHVLWNAFEAMCKDSELFEELQDVLDSLLLAVSDTQLMRKVRGVLCVDDPASEKVFTTKAKMAIDWRWETMVKAMDSILPMYPTMLTKWDEKKLLCSDSSGKTLSSNKIKHCTKALSAMPHFEVVCGLFRQLGKIVYKYASELEICDCHHDLWQKGRTFKRRRAMMTRLIGSHTCVWMGRRLAWWIAVGFFEFVKEVRTYTTDSVQAFSGAPWGGEHCDVSFDWVAPYENSWNSFNIRTACFQIANSNGNRYRYSDVQVAGAPWGAAVLTVLVVFDYLTARGPYIEGVPTIFIWGHPFKGDHNFRHPTGLR